MTESYQKRTVLVVTEDVAVLSSLIEGNTTDYQFLSRNSMQSALEDPAALIDNEIVIFDIDSVAEGANAIVELSIKLKKTNPTQILILIGDPEPLGEVLRSSIQPIIYRAFSKPIHPNQIFLAFDSACKLHKELVVRSLAGEDLLTIGPIENRANVNTVIEKQKNKPALYAGLSLASLLVVGGILFSMNNSNTPDQNEATPITPLALAAEEVSVVNADGEVEQINSLNQSAALALLDGRKITPSENNALYYYDQVLAIDPYDHTAYEGRKALVADLKISYSDLVDQAQFDKALQTLNVLQEIEPLDPTNYEAKQNLELEINQYLARLKIDGTANEIARMSQMMGQIGSQLQSSKTAAEALQKEQTLLSAIDLAIETGNLVPPTSGNAYDLVAAALQENQISKVNFAPRLSNLNDSIIESAINALNQDDLEGAQKLSDFASQLGVDPQNIAFLETSIQDRQAVLTAEQEKLTAEQAEEVEPVEVASLDAVAPPDEEIIEEAAKITPASIISREPPTYPQIAVKQDLEGWVSVGFMIDADGVPQDIKVVDSDPSNAFQQAAIEAVEKWRFDPAKNEQTNLPVDSFVEATKLNFKLTD